MTIPANILCGIENIGPSTKNLATVQVSFQGDVWFLRPPVVVTANTLQGLDYPVATKPIPDTFAVSVTGLTSDDGGNVIGFTANVYRVDNLPAVGGWAQDLQLGWIAMAGPMILPFPD